ncbi:MAG: 2-dehydropantoate 2-reductase [Spirochaetales bacterium]|jgi:2-dehydropantoate 2-reductase|nr:2-dehydropantoate 2-reductase [Spirochaetales bacterium]
MKISVIGSGAMGCLFGGFLSRAGHEVLLYDIFKAHVEAINSQGLQIEESSTGETLLLRPRASWDPREAAEAELLIIFVKSTATQGAAEQFSRLAGRGTLALTLQNGLGNEEILRRAFGEENTAAGVTSQGATFLGPGRIRHAGSGPTYLCMSCGDNRRLRPVIEAFEAAGFETKEESRIAELIWSKLIINVGINALTALTGFTNGRLPAYPELRAIMEDLVNEAAEVAKAAGIPLHHADPLGAVLETCRKTGANRSSMLQDFSRGTPSEIDFINNAIVREGAKLGIPTPVNRTIANLVKALDAFHQEADKS